MPKTYPAYFGTYDRFGEIRDYVDRFANMFLIGRNGMHRYNNQDHSMLTAMVEAPPQLRPLLPVRDAMEATAPASMRSTGIRMVNRLRPRPGRSSWRKVTPRYNSAGGWFFS